MSDKKYHIETLAIHAGQDAHGDPATNARAVPVYRTTAYNFRDSKHGADLFGLRELGNIYARLMNPTNDVLAKRIAALEGGAAAQTLSSGTAAIYFTVTNIARAGDEIVAASNLYGGTFSQFDAILPNVGIKAKFTPVNDFGAVEAAITEKTRLGFSSSRPSATPPLTSRTSKATRPSRTATACRSWWTPRSPRRRSSAPSTTARTS